MIGTQKAAQSFKYDIGTFYVYTEANNFNYKMSNTNFLKNSIKVFSLVAIAMLMACSGQLNSQEVNFEEEKEQLVADLEKMKNTVNDAIKDVEDKMNINEGPVERTLEETKANLEEKMKDIDKALNSAKSSTEENWEKVKEEADTALSQIQAELDKVKADIKKSLDKISQ